MNRTILVGVIAVLVVLFAFSGSAFTVNQYQAAIVLRLGELKRVIEEPGLKFKVPLVENVVYLDKRVLNFDAPAQELLTADQKRVVISAFVRYKIVKPYIFYQVGRTTDNAEGQIRSVLGSTLRTVIGNVAMQDILTPRRAVLMTQITNDLTALAAVPYGIEIVDVRFKRVDLPSENSETIFNQMRTQRAQEAAGIRAEGDREAREKRAEADKEQVVRLSEARRQAEILRGQGDAEATKVYNEAFSQDPAFFDFYRSMQAMRDGLGGSNTAYVGAPTGDFFRFFDRDPDNVKSLAAPMETPPQAPALEPEKPAEVPAPEGSQ
jgi:membrane protease subunit HflC